MKTPSTSAAIYARISDDREGLELGVARFVADSHVLASRDGRSVPESLVFTDNDISASTRSTATRPSWDRLVALIKEGRVGHVYAYSNSRLTRRPRDLEDLIQLHEQTGVVFHTVVSGTDDLSTADGRMTARIKASVDAAEAERIGERVSRQKRQRADMGLPQGGRYATFGFTKEWDPIPDEVTRLREAFRRRASGESVSSIAKATSIPHGTLVRVLTNPVYAGLRRHKGEVVGEMHPDFPRLVERDVFDAAQGVAVAPPAGTNSRRYLLSGIARCGACGGKMKGAPSSARAARYRCASTYGGCGKVTIRCDWIDEPIKIAAVSREVFTRKDSAPAAPDPADAAASEVVAARQDVQDLQDAVRTGEITMRTALPMLRDAEARLRTAEKEHRVAVTRTVDPNWAYLDATQLFGLELGEMRALIARQVSSVEIAPSPTRGRNGLDLTRVLVHFADGSQERLENSVG